VKGAWCDSCQIYLTAVYDQLLRVGKDNETLEPRLATEWAVSDNGLTYTFTLDPEAVFSDGSPVEAKDVAFSLERLKNLEAGASFLAAGIDSIDSSDPGTVVVTLSAPDPEFLGKVSSPYGAIINSDVAAEHGATAGPDASQSDKGEAWLLENSAGSGAYDQGGHEIDKTGGRCNTYQPGHGTGSGPQDRRLAACDPLHHGILPGRTDHSTGNRH